MDKQDIREAVWDELEESGEARFPYPPHGRIPNFNGASDAADRLSTIGAWQDAAVIKSNPDSPQLPVRRAALRTGKTIYMAVPRLKNEKCFLRLDPDEIDDINHATTIGGSAEVGVPVSLDEMEPIDLIVSGSVAGSAAGDRIGKGEGYSDLEFAILRECGLVDDDTTVVSTVHECQVYEDLGGGDEHDVPLDEIVTPERRIRVESDRSKPTGIAWGLLSKERIEEIPILKRLQQNST